MNRKAIGDLGEIAVCEYLKQNGYTIRDRNFHARCGEIDIIAVNDDVMCFVEVKTRRLDSWETGDEAVGRTKQNRIIRTAYRYIEKHDLHDEDWCFRYDIASVSYWQDTVTDIDYLENAFDESDFSL